MKRYVVSSFRWDRVYHWRRTGRKFLGYVYADSSDEALDKAGAHWTVRDNQTLGVCEG